MIVLVLFAQIYFVLAENPSSENYILKQWGFASGNNTGNQPSSENFVLTGSAVGIITDENASSTNYEMIPGYYLGPLTSEILPPESVTITVDANTVYLEWNAVQNANSYSVYSSSDPYASYETWTLKAERIGTTNWNESISSSKLFYYVKALTEPPLRNFHKTYNNKKISGKKN